MLLRGKSGFGECGHSFWFTIEEFLGAVAEKQAWCWRVPSSFWSTLLPSGKLSSRCQTCVHFQLCHRDGCSQCKLCRKSSRFHRCSGLVVDVVVIMQRLWRCPSSVHGDFEAWQSGQLLVVQGSGVPMSPGVLLPGDFVLGFRRISNPFSDSVQLDVESCDINPQRLLT